MTDDISNTCESKIDSVGTESTPAVMKQPFGANQDYTDSRKLWEWESRYPVKARTEMRIEACVLLTLLFVALLGSGASLGFNGQSIALNVSGIQFWINFRLIAIFFVGILGGVTFSMKWLIHAVAKGKWHLDRRFWRLMVPAIGGVYACVVMTLFGAGMFGTQPSMQNPLGSTAALAFLVGYFSDGVSGLLSNVANAVFGTLEKK